MKRPLFVLFLVVFVDLLGFGMVIPLMPRYAKQLGAPVELIGLLSTGYSAAQFLFAPLWGRLSDRVGRRPVLLVSIAMTSAAFLAYGLAESFWLLLATRLFAGVATANLPIAYAYVADVTTEENRAKGMGVIGAAFGLGFVLGPALGGILAGTALGLGAPGFAAAGLAALNLVLAFFILPEPARRDTRAPGAPGRFALLRQLAGDSHMVRLLLCYFFAIGAFAAMENTLSLAAADRFGLHDQQIGYVFAFVGVVLVVVQGGLIGPLTRRFGETRLLVAGLFLMALALALLPVVPGVPGLLAVMVPLAAGSGLMQPSVTALISRRAAANVQGGALGVAQSASAMGRIVGPESGTFVYQLAPASPFLGAAVVMAFAGILGLTLGRPKPPL
ncbi:MAG: MFS transporter [Polyangiaceae bacterium]|nr:MFS transporter [Polyangiaceae bacterium]